MKKLAICVPTYNRPEMIQEMLIRCAGIYKKFETDVYFYDSSDNSETKNIVLEYIENFNNLFYRTVPATIHSNIKVLNIYQEFTASLEYEYLWICPDYIQLTEEGAECIRQMCEKEFDICVLNYRDVEGIGEKIYSDVNSFFVDCAWHMTSYMATIIRIHSFLHIDWKGFLTKYTVSKRINHSHVALYFEQSVRLSEFKAIHIPFMAGQMRVSSYRGESYWKEDIFYIWCDCWPDTIRALPAQYNNKNIVIKKLGVNSGMFSWDNFVKLRRSCIFNQYIFERYKGEWRHLTNVPVVLLWILAKMPPFLIPGDIKKTILTINLKKFCRSYTDIYIYGCGFTAGKISLLLDEIGIKYKGYVVSRLDSEKRSYNGYEVIEYCNSILNSPRTGIILALDKKNTLEVMRNNRNLWYSKKVFKICKYKWAC